MDIPKQPWKVLVYGDSITEGLDLPSEERENRWVDAVNRRTAGHLVLINEGKGGRPTGALAEFQEVLQRQPEGDLLVMALGGNDARNITEACVPEALANLKTMILQAREKYGPSLEVLIVGPTNIRKDALGPTRPIANEREGKLKELNAAYPGLASELRCHFISLYGVIPPECLLTDGVHPDSRGHGKIARVMQAELLRIADGAART